MFMCLSKDVNNIFEIFLSTLEVPALSGVCPVSEIYPTRVYDEDLSLEKLLGF